MIPHAKTFKDLTGRTFGRWAVLAEVPKTRPGQTRWRCQCICGAINESIGYTTLTQGRSRSCGCLRRELRTKPLHAIHNRRNRTYRAWDNVKGGTSPEWSTFDPFLRDMGPRPEGTRLRRRDQSKPFCKDNCFWE